MLRSDDGCGLACGCMCANPMGLIEKRERESVVGRNAGLLLVGRKKVPDLTQRPSSPVPAFTYMRNTHRMHRERATSPFWPPSCLLLPCLVPWDGMGDG